MSDVSIMRDVVVVGGGCYGTFYGGQLAKARDKGRARFRRVVIVDRDPACRARRELGEAPDRAFVVSEWAPYFDAFLGSADPTEPGAPADYIVPSPLMPHLMFQWVLRRAQARWPERTVAVEAIPLALGTPYERSAPAPDNTRYVSFADWVCPTHCVEPSVCPATGGPRDWEMSRAVTELAARLRAAGDAVSGPALFQCRHQVFGVGAFAVGEVLAGDELVCRVGAEDGPAAVLIGTVSSCHGAVNLLRIGSTRAALARP
ncbi:MAG TPA: hypothetical protein VLV16_11820 [Gemmatimonadales bacterium]|nr:hypothetical protein [Gemmatimonadales bacterium]